MALTYEAIDTTTIAGTTTTTVNFTSIPQTYTDIILVANLSSVSDDIAPTIRLGNGTIDTGSNYSDLNFGHYVGAGLIAFQDTNANRMRFARTGASTTQPIGISIVNFQDYSNTTTFKTVLGTFGGQSNSRTISVGTWRSTAAIDAIQITEYSGFAFSPNSVFTLYGIKAA